MLKHIINLYRFYLYKLIMTYLQISLFFTINQANSGDEILRLKQITGLASLFKETKFGKAWIPIDDENEEEID